MESVKIEITPGGNASRAEAIIRIIYGAIALIILAILIWIAWILAIINFFTCLILAKRIAAGFVASIVKQMARVYSYVFFVTDERPPLVP